MTEKKEEGVMSEELCLKWDDFQENINSAFRNLRGDNEFTDVTLACDDGWKIEAHKLILSVSSPLLESLLKDQDNHSLIYLRGIKHEDLKVIIDYLYQGEANVLQENLGAFLAIAEELKLTGLSTTIVDKIGNDGEWDSDQNQTDVIFNDDPANIQKTEEDFNDDPVNVDKIVTEEVFKTQPMNLDKNQIEEEWVFEKDPVALDKPKNMTKRKKELSNLDRKRRKRKDKSLAIDFISGDLHELDKRVKSMMEKSQRTIPGRKEKAYIYTCNLCGKEGEVTAIRDHIEAKHLEGVSLPCDNCGKILRSRVLLRKHECKELS